MQLIERISNMGSSFKAILVFIALLPSLATLVGIFPVPDQISTLVTFLFGFLGIGAVLLVSILSDTICRWSATKVSLIAAAVLLAGTAIAITYVVFAERHVVTVNDAERHEQFLIPLMPDADLLKVKSTYEGDWREALQNSNMRWQIMQAMRDQSSGTEILMIVMLVFGQVCLVTGVALAAWRATKGEDNTSAPNAP